jgi:membrane protein insertase Oxa1/YidC/SpoIIIJ
MHVGSALAIYWTTSNGLSMLQTAAIRKVIDRRIRSGALKI